MTDPAPARTASPAPRWRPTLALVFSLSSVGLGLLVAGLFYVFQESSARSLMETAEKQRHGAATAVALSVVSEMSQAPQALDNVETDVLHQVVDLGNLVSVEAALFSEMLAHPRLSEISFTAAHRTGFTDDGDIILAPGGRWQVTVERSASDPTVITTRRVHAEDDALVLEVREREADGGLQSVPFGAPSPAKDPTEHLTFQTAASRRFQGETLWSDLHYSQIDSALPEPRRRVILTVQRAVEDEEEEFLGVVRVGMVTSQLDALVHVRVNPNDAQDPHAVFLGDATGGLITRFSQDSRLQLQDGELRVEERMVPRAVGAALQSPITDDLSEEAPEAAGSFELDGQTYLMTFVRLPLGRDWLVGVVVPQAYYTKELVELRRRFLPVFMGILFMVLVVGGLTLRAIRRGLRQVAQAEERVRAFDFEATPSTSFFRDVENILDGLERAKTVMRALGKYVPVDLVRELFNANMEPSLGGKLQDLTIMFTDIKGFTGLSEQLTADDLAHKLGAYLEVMTKTIHGQAGVIDKFIGDAVMAMWNAPLRCDDHPALACRAALACVDATKALYASPAWQGLPPLHTRFGLHRDNVMVGHFGAPDRMSFTALGDGVNLASRLESLCKQYDVSIIVSQTIVEAAHHAFIFRPLDVVAVKGKKQGVRVYELVGPVGSPVPVELETYKQALGAYLGSDFAGAMALLAGQLHDGPSRVLSLRCQHFLASPPTGNWDGVWVATSK